MIPLKFLYNGLSFLLLQNPLYIPTQNTTQISKSHKLSIVLTAKIKNCPQQVNQTLFKFLTALLKTQTNPWKLLFSMALKWKQRNYNTFSCLTPSPSFLPGFPFYILTRLFSLSFIYFLILFIIHNL